NVTAVLPSGRGGCFRRGRCRCCMVVHAKCPSPWRVLRGLDPHHEIRNLESPHYVGGQSSAERRPTLRSSRPRAVRWPAASAARALRVQVPVPLAREGTRPAERKTVGPTALSIF